VVGLVALTLAGITLVIGFDLWRRTAQDFEVSETTRLEGVAAALALSLDGNLHESWNQAFPSRDALTHWNQAPEGLQEAREILVQTQQNAKIKSPIYTLRLRDEFVDEVRANPDTVIPAALEFVLTSAEEPYWHHTYEYRPEMARSLFLGKISSTPPYETVRGKWLSAFAPIRDRAGRIVGILEVDAPIDSKLIGAKHRLTGHVGGLLLCFFGSMLLVIALHRDMRLREIETEKLAMVATRTDNGVLITSPNGQIEWTNEGFTRLSGWSQHEAEGEQLEDKLRSSEHPEGFATISDAIEKGGATTLHVQSNRKSGEAFWTELDLQPIRDGKGRISNWVVVQSDVTQQMKTARLLESARDKALESARLQNEFLANVGHELRTPLNAVIGMSGLLADSDLDVRQARFVEAIGASANILLTQITELMEYARIQAGTAEVQSIEISPYDLVSGVLKGFRPQATQSGLTLEESVGPESPATFLGDPNRITHVLTLLLSNAFKFTEKGSIDLHVGGKDEQIIFAVRDTGVGIPREQVSRIFDSFRQVDGSTTRKFGGTGLGLAMAHRLVEMMQGEIGVDTEEGSGSTFWFALPRSGSITGAGDSTPLIDSGNPDDLAQGFAAA